MTPSPSTRSAVTAQGLVLLSSLVVLGQVATQTGPALYTGASNAPSQPGGPGYAVIDLGTNQVPQGINNLGSVVLSSRSTGSSFWKNGSVTNLPATSSALALNDQDQVGLDSDLNVVIIQYSSNSHTNRPACALPIIWSYPGKITKVAAPATSIDNGGALTTGYMSDSTGAPWSSDIVALGNDSSFFEGTVGFFNPGDSTYPGESYIFQNGFNSPNSPTPMPTGAVIRFGNFNTELVIALNSGTSFFPTAYDPVTGTAAGYNTTYTSQSSSINFANNQPSHTTSVAAYAVGSTVTPLSDSGATITGVNSLGEILGSVNGTTKVWNRNAATTNLVLTGTPAGQWNASHQILTTNNLWITGTNYLLPALLPPSSGWTGLAVQYSTNYPGFRSINDAGAIVGTATYSGTNTAIPAGSHGVMLLPIELKDVKNEPDTTDDVTIAPMGTLPSDDSKIDDYWKSASDQNIAWIVAHRNDGTSQADNPLMPQIEIKFPGCPDGLNIKYKFKCSYDRGNGLRKGSNLDEDTITIDKTSTPLPANQAWKLYQEPAWQGDFFGGNCELTYQIVKSDGSSLTPEITVRFVIAGKNPDADKAKAYIASSVATKNQALWYSYAIGKEESRDTLAQVIRDTISFSRITDKW